MWAPTRIFSDPHLMQEQFAWMLWEIMNYLSVFMCLNTYKDCPYVGSGRKFHPSNYLIMKLPRNQLCWSSNSTSLEIQEFPFSRLNPLTSVCYLLLGVFVFCKRTCSCCCVAADVLWLLAGNVAVAGHSLLTAIDPGSSDLPCRCTAEESHRASAAAAAFADCLVISSSEL